VEGFEQHFLPPCLVLIEKGHKKPQYLVSIGAFKAEPKRSKAIPHLLHQEFTIELRYGIHATSMRIGLILSLIPINVTKV
jgi:hypothetical protein